MRTVTVFTRRILRGSWGRRRLRCRGSPGLLDFRAMVHKNEDGLRASITEEVTRISSLNDTIARMLNNILVYGSVGMIVASITFLKDIAGPHPRSLALLKVAWIFLVVAAAVSVISLLTSRRAGTIHRNVLAKRLSNETEAEAKLKAVCDRWNSATRYLQRAGLIGLAAGTGLLVCFAMINLPTEANAMADKEERVTTGVPPDSVPKHPEPPRPPMPGHREDKAFDHDTTNPFLQRPDTTIKPKDTEQK